MLCHGPGGLSKGHCLGGGEGCCGVQGLCTGGSKYLGDAKDKGVEVVKLESVDHGVQVMPVRSCVGHVSVR